MPFKKKDNKLTNIDTDEIFTLTRDPSNQNAGKCIWATANSNKTDGELFIKQYLSPKAPSTMASDEENDRRYKVCELFKTQKSKVFNLIKGTPHSHIISPVAFFQEKSSFYSVFPFKESTPSDEVLNTLSYADKLIILTQITSAVNYFHQHDLVHSDIKPTNLIISSNPLNTYLIDYDSAYFTQKPPEEVEGDFVYRSPEMIRYNNGSAHNPELLTVKSDIFALGILFYRILSGSAPQVEGTSSYVAQAIIDEVGYDLTLDATIDSRFENLIRRMLNPDPEERPSAVVIERELLKIISGEHALGKELYDSILKKLEVVGDRKFWKRCWQKVDDGFELKKIINESQKDRLSTILKDYRLNTEEASSLQDFDIKIDTSYDLDSRIKESSEKSNKESSEKSNKLKINIPPKKRW